MAPYTLNGAPTNISTCFFVPIVAGLLSTNNLHPARLFPAFTAVPDDLLFIKLAKRNFAKSQHHFMMPVDVLCSSASYTNDF